MSTIEQNGEKFEAIAQVYERMQERIFAPPTVRRPAGTKNIEVTAAVLTLAYVMAVGLNELGKVARSG